MITPNDGYEFCIIGNGKQIHVRATGTPASSQRRKPLCGAARGANRGYLVNHQHFYVFTPEQIDDMLSRGRMKLCATCAKRTTE